MRYVCDAWGCTRAVKCGCGAKAAGWVFGPVNHCPDHAKGCDVCRGEQGATDEYCPRCGAMLRGDSV